MNNAANRKNCPRCGASYVYHGRRDLLAVMIDCLDTMARADKADRDSETGREIYSAFGTVHATLEITLRTAYGECWRPECASAVTAALDTAVSRRREARERQASEREREERDRLPGDI